MVAVPGFALAMDQQLPGRKTCDKRDAEVDADTFGNFTDRYVHDCATKPEPARQDGHEDERVDRKEQHLENRVECYQTGTIISISRGQVVPHDHHSDAAREAD